MAKIGQLRKSTNVNTPNVIVGSIRTLAHSVQVHLHPNSQAEIPSQPAYIAFAISDDGELVEIGGAWLKKHDGRDYLSMSLDDPSWSAPLSCAAFQSKDKPGEWDVVWNRPERAAA